MDLSVYDIIKGPVLTEKAQRVNQDFGKLVVEVHRFANKPMIKKALKKLFNVEVAKIGIQVRKGKTRRVARTRLQTTGSDRKIAWITLKKGYTLDLYGHGQPSAAQQEAPQQDTK